MTTVQQYLQRYPHARRSTLRHLAKREEVTKQIKREVALIRRQRFLAKIKRVLGWRG